MRSVQKSFKNVFCSTPPDTSFTCGDGKIEGETRSIIIISSTRQPLLLENIFNSYSRLLWRPWGRVPVLPHLRQWWQRWIAQVGHQYHQYYQHHHHPHRHHRHHHHHYHGHSHLLFLWRQSWPAHRHTTSSSFSECFNVVRMCDRKLGVHHGSIVPLAMLIHTLISTQVQFPLPQWDGVQPGLLHLRLVVQLWLLNGRKEFWFLFSSI